MRLNFTKIFIAAAIVLAATVTSCKAPQSLAYFENADSLKTVGTTALDYAVKIRPADELIITVNSIVPEATAAYNLPLVNPSLEGEVGVSSTPQNQTYIVNTDGEITMPAIGKIHAACLLYTSPSPRDQRLVRISDGKDFEGGRQSGSPCSARKFPRQRAW